jgi:hypothetical protein
MPNDKKLSTQYHLQRKKRGKEEEREKEEN